jgi:hypothetical protein
MTLIKINKSLRLWQFQDRAHYYFRFKEKAKANPNRVFVVFEGKEYTFRQLEKGKRNYNILV